MADGMSAQEARRRAESAFGSRQHCRSEALRERRRYYAVTDLGREVALAELDRMGAMMAWAREISLAR